MTNDSASFKPTFECTLALLAYNQEKYIFEAMTSAVAQTFPSLEIIVSDDCSSDSTFDKITSFCRSYSGCHSLRVIRQPRNLGTIDHLITVSREAKGRLLIIAACDDISYPNRVLSLYELWKTQEPFCVYSAADIISSNGNVIGHIYTEYLERIQDLFQGCLIPIRFDGIVRNIPGYAAAYDRDVIASLPLCNSNALNEDALTTYIANLTGSLILSTPDTLLARRDSESSLTPGHQLRSFADMRRNERNIALFASSSIAFIEYFSSLSFLNSPDYRVVLMRLRAELSYHRITSRFWCESVFARARLLFLCRTKEEFFFVLPRLLGISFLLYSKYLFSFLKCSLKKILPSSR